MTTIHKWRPVVPLDPTVAERLRGDLAAIDALHRSWRRFTSSLAEADKNTLRRRTLRKHAIETGIPDRDRTSARCFTFSHDEEVDDRAAELYDWLDQSLAVALQKLMRRTLGGRTVATS